jgi:hypothetical protein
MRYIRTRTIEIEETAFLITAEVDREGTIREAMISVVHMENTPISCTEAVKQSPYFSRRVQEQFEELDWDDHGYDDFESLSLKDTVAKIIGVKPA